MRKPFEYTLTPADRIVFQKCLIAVCLFYACGVLFIAGLAIAGLGGSRAVETAAVNLDDDLACASALQTGIGTCGAPADPRAPRQVPSAPHREPPRR
jgi:hypothetical protein